MAAKKDDLGALHKLVAKAYKSGIEVDMEDGIYNPALLSAAAKFLKDNEITAEIKSDDDLASLRDKLRQNAEDARSKGRQLLSVANGLQDFEP